MDIWALLTASKHANASLIHRVIGQNVHDDVKSLPSRVTAYRRWADSAGNKTRSTFFFQHFFAECFKLGIICQRFELQVFSEPSQATCLLFANPLRALHESFASSPTVPHKLASDSCISHSRVSLEGIFESSAKSSTVQSENVHC